VSIVPIVKMILGLVKRCQSDAEESAELARVVASETFGDIAWRGSRRFTDLIAEFNVVCRRSAGDYCIDFVLEAVRQLPDDEILETANDHVLCASTNRSTDART
jgi:hypothetical protein